VSYGPSTFASLVSTSAQGYPFPYGLGDNSTSAWITPTTHTFGPETNYTYKTSFDLTTAKIVGRYANDDPLVGMAINGHALTVSGGAMGSWTSFTIASGFVAGINALQFTVNNTGGPTGLRVEFTGNNFASGPLGLG
jgi:hypothetical protein